MSKFILASILGLAMLLTAAPTTTHAGVHGMFGDGYSSGKSSYGYKKTRTRKRYGKRRSYKRRSARSYSKRRYGKRRVARRSSRRSSGSASASRTCLKASARALLNRIESNFGRVHVISTCRPGAVIRGSGKPSKHRYGLAVDFKAPSGKKAAIVRWLIKNHQSGGTMTYSGMSHIHVDIGPKFVSLGAGRRG